MPVVTFDLWHTLVQLSPDDEDRYIDSQERRLADLLAASPVASIGGPSVAPITAAREALIAASERNVAGAPITELALDAARRAGRRARPEAWVREVEAAVDHLAFEIVPGAREQLAGLRDRGLRVAVVSNLVGETGRSMRRVMERLGLAQYIEAWAFSDELPWAKPAPEIFWKAIEPLGVPPAEAVHVGDLASDVLGARSAGFRGAVLFQGARAYGRRYTALFHTATAIDPPPDRIIDRWTELPAALESLLSGPPAGSRVRRPAPPSSDRPA